MDNATVVIVLGFLLTALLVAALVAEADAADEANQ